MNKAFIILGILIILPFLTVFLITDPMDIEDEIDVNNIALIDLITIYYMLISSFLAGISFIALGVGNYNICENNTCGVETE